MEVRVTNVEENIDVDKQKAIILLKGKSKAFGPRQDFFESYSVQMIPVPELKNSKYSDRFYLEATIIPSWEFYNGHHTTYFNGITYFCETKYPRRLISK
jgi:hypothetical protein